MPPHATCIVQRKWWFLSLVVVVAVVAWLLDCHQTPLQTPGKKKKRNADMARSYSLADSNVDMAADDAMMEEEEEIEEESAENNPVDLIAECAASPVVRVMCTETAAAAAAAADMSFFQRHTFPSSSDAQSSLSSPKRMTTRGRWLIMQS